MVQADRGQPLVEDRIRQASPGVAYPHPDASASRPRGQIKHIGGDVFPAGGIGAHLPAGAEGQEVLKGAAVCLNGARSGPKVGLQGQPPAGMTPARPKGTAPTLRRPWEPRGTGTPQSTGRKDST